MTVGAPRPPPIHTTFGPLMRRWWQIRDYGGGVGLAGAPPGRFLSALGPAFGGRGAQAPSRLKDLVVLADLDRVTLRRREDLLPRRLLGARGLELGLVPPRHRVPNVRLVVDGEMAFAASVDVSELPSVQLLVVLGVELCHRVAPFHRRTLHNADPPRTGARARRGTKQAAG